MEYNYNPGNPGGALRRLNPATPQPSSEDTLYAPSLPSNFTQFTQTTSYRSTAPSELPSEDDDEVTSEDLLIDNLNQVGITLIRTRYPDLSGIRWRY